MMCNVDVVSPLVAVHQLFFFIIKKNNQQVLWVAQSEEHKHDNEVGPYC